MTLAIDWSVWRSWSHALLFWAISNQREQYTKRGVQIWRSGDVQVSSRRRRRAR